MSIWKYCHEEKKSTPANIVKLLAMTEVSKALKIFNLVFFLTVSFLFLGTMSLAV